MQCWLWQIGFKLLTLIEAGSTSIFKFLTSCRNCRVLNSISFLILGVSIKRQKCQKIFNSAMKYNHLDLSDFSHCYNSQIHRHCSQEIKCQQLQMSYSSVSEWKQLKIACIQPCNFPVLVSNVRKSTLQMLILK